MGGFLNWWDGVELWLSGLGFVAQTAVVMPVVLALAYGIANLLDGALGTTVDQQTLAAAARADPAEAPARTPRGPRHYARLPAAG